MKTISKRTVLTVYADFDQRQDYLSIIRGL